MTAARRFRRRLDRPGIIAGVAERLAAHGANVTDSRMAILRGHFAMTLIVEGAEREALARRPRPGSKRSRRSRSPRSPRRPPTPARNRPPSSPSTAPTTPGILAAVTRVLAEAGVNVCDLQTRLAQSLYVMVMDVAVPPDDRRPRRPAAGAVAAEQDVTITLRPLEPDVL